MIFKNAFVQSVWELVDLESASNPTYANKETQKHGAASKGSVSISSSEIKIDGKPSHLTVCDCEEIFKLTNPFRMHLLNDIVQATSTHQNMPKSLVLTSIGSGKLLFEALLILELLEYVDSLEVHLIDEVYAFGSSLSPIILKEFLSTLQVNSCAKIQTQSDLLINGYQRLWQKAIASIGGTNDFENAGNDANQISKSLSINFIHSVGKYSEQLRQKMTSCPHICVGIDTFSFRGDLDEVFEPQHNLSLMDLMPNKSLWFSARPSYVGKIYQGTLLRRHVKTDHGNQINDHYFPNKPSIA